MESKTCSIFSLFFLFSLLVSVRAQVPDNLCSLLPANLCKLLHPGKNPPTIYDNGRKSILDSISRTIDLSSRVNSYLSPESNLPESTVRGLQDCKILADLNQELLSRTLQSLLFNTILPISKAEDVQTLLSAVVTNHETCLTGLREVGCASSVLNALLTPWRNVGDLYSISFDLLLRCWVGVRLNLLPWIRLFNPDGEHQAGVIPKGVKASQVVFVNLEPGKGNFTTIGDAVNGAPSNTSAGNGYYVISIAEGVYEEYVSIPKDKKYIMMIGAGINKTIITGNRSVADGWTTFNSSTFAVVGEGFVAQKITFRNTAGAIKFQAVAVRNGADLSTFYQCSFEGYQDTLYTHSMRQFYKDCDIYGTIDFIFGNAAVVFQSCNIYPRLPIHGQFNVITAQGRTDINQNTGTSIQDCIIAPAPDLASSNGTIRTYLGRPWKTYSRTVVIQSYLESFINPAGWAEWSGNTSLDTLYYAEFNNTGPGSDTTNRVGWTGFHLIGAAEAANFTVSQFIQGNNWLNGTGVPFYSGLS